MPAEHLSPDTLKLLADSDPGDGSLTKVLLAAHVVAALETLSLAALLINIALGNDRTVAALIGPLHGCLYLFVILAVIRDVQRTGRAVAMSIVPAVGGLLAAWELTRIDRQEAGTPALQASEL